MDKSSETISPPRGFEEVYAKYRTYFVGIAMSYVRDRMAAEDIVTDSFVSYWENRAATEVQHAPAYIFTAVKNRCLNWLEASRQHAQARQDIHSTTYRLTVQSIASCEANEPQSLLMAEVGAIVEREILRMPERMRRVFIAHRYEEMSYREIARLYELSEGQVQYEIRTAKQLLKVALKDYIPALVTLFLH